MNRQPYVEIWLHSDEHPITAIQLADLLMGGGFSLKLSDGTMLLFTENDDVDWVYVSYNLTNIIRLYNLIKEKHQKNQYLFIQLSGPDAKHLWLTCHKDKFMNDYVKLSFINEILSPTFFYDPLDESKNLFKDYLNVLIPCINARYKVKKIDCYVGEFPDVFLTFNEVEIEENFIHQINKKQ